MAALIDALRWPHFISEDDPAQASTEGKGGVPRYNGEPSKLAEYTFRVRARIMKEKTMGDDEAKKLGPLACASSKDSVHKP